MKILGSILLVFVLSLAVLAQSQDQSSSQSSQSGQSSQSSQSPSGQGQASTGTTSSSGQNMSGTVSHDRKNFTNDQNSKSYKVDNPDALSGKEDQHVALIVHVDPDNNAIHVIQVAPPQ